MAEQKPQQIVISGTSTNTTPSGYTCPTCGLWVTYGLGHQCTYPINVTHPSYWTAPMSQQIIAFKGARKTLKDLPSNAAKGHAYYVEANKVLVVREAGGWFHFDSQ